MGLYRRKDSPFLWMSFSVNNRPYQRSTGTEDRKLAESIYAKVKTLVVEGKWFNVDEAKHRTFDELMEKLIKDHAPKVSERMQKSYRNSLPHLLDFFSGMTLDKVEPDLIMQYTSYRRGQKCRPGTRNRELAMLSKAFNLARLWKWVRENPCSMVTREKEDNENIGRCLTEDEEQRLLEACRNALDGQLREIIIVGMHTGMRESEILSMRWSKIDLKESTIATTQKGNRIKIVPMNDTVFGLLKEKSKVRSMSGYVFTTSEDTPFIARNMYREYQKAVRRSGIGNFRFHDLRHTCGTRLARAGHDIYAIASVLGHTQLSTAKRYARHNTESLRKVVKSLDKRKAVNE